MYIKKNRVPKEKINMIAEAIFNSLLRYGVAVFLKPVYDEEDLKGRKLPKNTNTLQTLQNSMIGVIYGLKIQNRVNMKNVREKIKMMSVNQIAVYHTLLEAYNVMSPNYIFSTIFELFILSCFGFMQHE